MPDSPLEIAVIGAGIAGATLVDSLAQKHGVALTVFEKSRGIGGRMSTRYSGDHEYDHGAQYFIARGSEFRQQIKKWLQDKTIAEWQPRVVTLSPQKKPFKRLWFEPHYVSQPRMNDLCKRLLSQQEVIRGTRVIELEQRQNQHYLLDEKQQTHGPFDWVISTAPAEQTMELLAESRASLSHVEFDPCFALMLPWQGELPGWQAAKVNGSMLEWLCFNQYKPGRSHAPALLVHSCVEWARANFDRPLNLVKAEMLEALAELIELTTIGSLEDASIHRWRYARTSRPLGEPYWCNTNARIAACGDWCLGSGVEDAFTSAKALANLLASEMTESGH